VTFASTPSRPHGCASDLDLDELLSGDLAGQPKELALRAHVESCSRCRARFAAFAAVEPPPAPARPADIAPAPQGAPALGSVGARRPPRRRWAMAGLGAAMAAAIIVLVARPPAGPGPADGERTKGALALTVFVKRAGGAVDLVDREGELHAGDELRFALVSAAPGHAVVLGLDAAPSVTVYAPSASSAGAIPIDATGSITLPGSIVADATAGAERIVALVCATATPPDVLRARATAALAAANGRPEQVGSLGSGCRESSVLLHKIPSGR
jgi:hypothetical protein